MKGELDHNLCGPFVGYSHIYSGEKLSEALSSGYGSFEARFGWQPSNPDHWANVHYGSVSYGVGFYSGYIGDPAIFGYVHFVKET